MISAERPLSVTTVLFETFVDIVRNSTETIREHKNWLCILLVVDCKEFYTPGVRAAAAFHSFSQVLVHHSFLSFVSFLQRALTRIENGRYELFFDDI
jgi:uncharacterized membrane protein